LCQGEVIELDDLPEHFPGARPAVAATLAAPSYHLPPASAVGLSTPVAGPWAADGHPTAEAAASPFLVPRASPPDNGVLPPVVRSTLAESRERTELWRITEALERNGRNRLRAAAELGISRMTLYKKLHKYGLMGA